ncbi:MAG: hypothetical protein DRG63_10710 [Deltaproteobacteria bacterium]|nr:MAG: hypothetical protein DRG63_10710 [Deltaproteobacteria bacterium]
MKKSLIAVVFIVLFLGIATFVYYGQWRQKTVRLYYSGTIEATESNLAFQVSGRVQRILVDDGMQVEKGQLLAELQRDEFVTRLEQARAATTQAEENVRRLESLLELYKATLPHEVARAKANVAVLRAKLQELETGYRIQQVEEAKRVVETAKLRMEDARKDKIRSERLYRQKTISEKQRDAAVLRYKTALKEYQKAKEALSLLEEGFRRESIVAARAKLAAAKAALKQARGNLKRIEITKNELKAAKAMLKEVRAAERLAELYLEYTQLKAPFKGIITSRNVEPGEVVSPAREVMSIADLSTVDLKVFVGEPELGHIKPGQKVRVKTDTFPNKTYEGYVSYISPEAEFTPKIIQTHKERVKLVYLVKVTIPNPHLELKPGMPADAWFD